MSRHYSWLMQLDGRMWFDFANPQVWHFYQFIRAFAKAGNTVALDWIPFYQGSEAEAMSVYIGLSSPLERGRFLHALLGLVHLEGLDPDDREAVLRAMDAAGVSGGLPLVDTSALEAMAANAKELGVTSTPTLYQLGPVAHIVVNSAASRGHLELTAQTIMSVLSDDGIWSITKP